MSAVSIADGWKIFFAALKEERWWSLRVAAEWMYRLNVFARSIGRHQVRDHIHLLKDDFIKYLYQHGYCREVRLHVQKKECWSCDGTGEYWTGEECWKCHGTGTFSKTELYAFRFNIEGKHYAWHQLKHLVDYPVTLTESQSANYTEPPERDAAILKLQDAWLGLCVVWWCLLVHGRIGTLLLFLATWYRVKAFLGITAVETWLVHRRADLVFWWRHDSPWAKRRADDPEYFEIEQVSADDLEDIPS